jgi:DNA-binding FrmR family transcriptional regulator|tara:strand:- start:127 stop:417 length:291 start_codon:yes stop_codon:yes gene_type:complete
MSELSVKESKTKSQNLVFRLNRVIGQLESLKKELNKDPLDQDCVKTFNQLKASINGLKSFGEAYMSEHLEECLKQEVEIKEIMEKLKPVMNSIFKL